MIEGGNIRFKSHRAWEEIDRKTQRLYEQGLSLVANHVLKDGARVGSEELADFTKGFADAIYAKLLVVEETDGEGKPVKRERRRFANAAMTACRRAWFVAQRAEERKVPAVNPFAKMGLKTRSVGRAPRETPTATWLELETFRMKALELGHPSLATAALIAWEWLQREEHLFGAFEAAHYRPKERPNSVRIVHPKTGEEAWWPLHDERGELLFPELMAELDAHQEPNSLGTNDQTRSKGSEGGRTAAVDHGQRRTRLSAGDRQGDRSSRQVARRSLLCLVPPR